MIDARRLRSEPEVVRARLAAREDADVDGLLDNVMALDERSPRIGLPMERPLFAPPVRPVISEHILDHGDTEIDAGVLFEQFYVDKERLRSRIRQALQTRHQIALAELLESHPLEQGLAELVAWLSIATGEGYGIIDEDHTQQVSWVDSAGRQRKATLPTVIFSTGRNAIGAAL